MNIWVIRSVLVIGLFLGIGIWLDGFIFGLCGTFGPFGTGCPAFNPYEVIGPLLGLISLAGLAYSFLGRRTTPSGTAS